MASRVPESHRQRLIADCIGLVGSTIVSADTTIGDGSDTDVFYLPLRLRVTSFVSEFDLTEHQPDGIIDSHLDVELADPKDVAKLPNGWRVLWVYGPSIRANGTIDKPRFEFASDPPSFIRQLIRWLGLAKERR